MSAYLPLELGLIQVRCYSCGQILIQDDIENGLKSGKTLAQVLDESGYITICCRRTIMESDYVVDLIEKLQQDKNIISNITELSVEETGLGDPISILKNSPFLATQTNYSSLNFMDSENTNPFDYYMSELNTKEEE